MHFNPVSLEGFGNVSSCLYILFLFPLSLPSNTFLSFHLSCVSFATYFFYFLSSSLKVSMFWNCFIEKKSWKCFLVLIELQMVCVCRPTAIYFAIYRDLCCSFCWSPEPSDPTGVTRFNLNFWRGYESSGTDRKSDLFLLVLNELLFWAVDEGVICKESVQLLPERRWKSSRCVCRRVNPSAPTTTGCEVVSCVFLRY